MENNTNFTLAIDKINAKIVELNIKISKTPNNETLNNELDVLLEDRNLLYKGNLEQVEFIMKKYGVTNNE